MPTAISSKYRCVIIVASTVGGGLDCIRTAPAPAAVLTTVRHAATSTSGATEQLLPVTPIGTHYTPPPQERRALRFATMASGTVEVVANRCHRCVREASVTRVLTLTNIKLASIVPHEMYMRVYVYFM